MKRYQEGLDETTLYAEVSSLGNDMVVHFFGGSKPHVGAVAVGIPRPSLKNPAVTSATVSVFTMVGHKDDLLASHAAKKLASDLSKNVVVVAGFHIEGANELQIKTVMENCNTLIEKIIRDH